ncbi:MAG: hypothetical protein ACLQSR_04215 [Limisphaerales bacterium]
MKAHTIGYHGCDLQVALDIVTRKKGLKSGSNRYDWLGSGVYFWEDNPHMAWAWARHTAKKQTQIIRTPAVLGAVIDFTDCLNLAQMGASKILEPAYNALVQEVARAGGIMPQNVGEEERYLDHAVFETLHELRKTQNLPPFKTVRALFQSGVPVFPNAGIRKWDHMQICVRDMVVIEGCFLANTPKT